MLAAAALAGADRPAERRFDPAVIALQVGAIGLAVWGALNQADGPYFPFVPDAPGYFKTLLLSIPVLVGGVVIGVALTLLALTRRIPAGGGVDARRASAGWRWGALVVALGLTALWILPALDTDATVGASGLIPSGHIPVAAQDYFAVVNGRTPMVDFVAQYTQLLPLLVAPLLPLFGLSITSFSVIMCALSVVALLAVFGVFRQVTGRPLAALALYVPFLAISLFPWADHGPYREFNGNYHGFFPGRYLGPFLIAWLCALAVRRERIPAWALFFAGGLAALNNAEFGSACLIALAAALLLGADASGGLLQRARTLAPHAAAGLAGAVVLVCSVTLIRAGGLPDPAKLTYFTRLFGRQSFGLEPMPALGLHIWIYFTCAGAILTAAVRYVRRAEDRTLTAMLAYSGVFGLIAGSYFAGRSLPFQLLLLFPVWGLAGILLAWTAFGYLRSARGSASLRRSFLPSLAAISGFGVMVAAIITLPAPWTQIERLGNSGPAVVDVPAVQRFVERRTTPGEPILLYGAPIDHRVAERAGVENVSPWNSGLTLYSPNEYRQAIDALEQAGGSKVFLRRVTLQGGIFGKGGSVTKLLLADDFREVVDDRTARTTLYENR